jgi:hypothetical protein
MLTITVLVHLLPFVVLNKVAEESETVFDTKQQNFGVLPLNYFYFPLQLCSKQFSLC